MMRFCLHVAVPIGIFHLQFVDRCIQVHKYGPRAAIQPPPNCCERIEAIMNETSQFVRRFRLRNWLIAGVLTAAVFPGAALVVSAPLPAKLPAEPEKLKLVADGTVTLDDINAPTSLDVSDDGQFVYMASFASGTLSVFKRDAATGKLALVQSLTSTDDEPLKGAVHIHLSPNNQFAAVSCLHDKSFILYGRDAKTGKLSMLDVLRGETQFDGKPVLSWTSDAAWSRDGKFLYVGDSQTNHIVVLQLANKKLKVAQVFEGRDECFANIRGLWAHPDGVTVFAASPSVGRLTVMDRDATDGKLSVREIIGSDTVEGLRGVMQVVCSSDGKFVYTSSGRFGGSHAVCAFKLGGDKKLKFIQSLSDAGGELPKFEGGNKLRISPDGHAVYVIGTNSNHIVGLQRDVNSGNLTLTEMIDATQLPGSLKGPNGLAFSPDGKHVYVSWEGAKSVGPFVRQRISAATAEPKKEGR